MAYVPIKTEKDAGLVLRKEGWKEESSCIWTKGGARLMKSIHCPEELIAWPGDHPEVESLRRKGLVG